MLKDFSASGAVVNAVTRKRVSHSRYPGHVDVDFQLPGTPLTWAVHHNRPHIVRMLLKSGAVPNLVSEGSALSALGLSAYYHHHECLKAIIEHLESQVTQRTTDGEFDKRHALLYGPFVREAGRAADKFSVILHGGADYMNRFHSTFDILREKTRLVNFQGQLQGSLLYTAVSSVHDEVVDYKFQLDWLGDTINKSIDGAQRTPVLETIRWNREALVQTLIDRGADIQALAANPSSPEDCNWSALHIFAHEGHDIDLAVVSKLVGLGLSPDGSASANSLKGCDKQVTTTPFPEVSTLTIKNGHAARYDIESSFAVTLRHNAFILTTKLLSLGADANHLANKSGLFVSDRPLTVLGLIIISNAQFSLAHLNYLLHLKANPTDFIVEPSHNLIALHPCAMAFHEVHKRTGGVIPRAEFDMNTNADIKYELLMKWRQQDELGAICGLDGSTALHLAVRAQNLAATTSLLEAGASTQVRNDHDETAVQLARKVRGQGADAKSIEAVLLRYER